MEDVSQPKDFTERLYWLIKLRWIAVVGVILAVLFAGQILKLPIPIFPLYAVAFALAVYNLVFLFLLAGIKRRTSLDLSPITERIANLQISFDLICLVTLLHFSGGIENPFIFYFIFHMIIASILLRRQAAFLQATLAVFLFCSMAILELSGVLPHYRLEGFIGSNQYNNFVYLAGVSFVFISTVYIAVYMATSISSRLREREKKLSEANALLMEKDRIKSEYVLIVTHDIKEHLAAIQSCIEPVTGGITGPLNEKQINLLQRADERTGKLLFFVKALLEITRIKLSKELNLEYFTFKEVLSEAVSYVALRAKDKNISINSNVESGINKIRGSKEYIQETVSNILANAVKYTPHNGKIDIYVSDKGNSILIEIEDTGIGIPKSELPRVFEEFYRASNAKKVEKDGTGLGLSIAKQIVERHNGKIWVESEEGKGSIFRILLPK